MKLWGNDSVIRVYSLNLFKSLIFFISMFAYIWLETITYTITEHIFHINVSITIFGWPTRRVLGRALHAQTINQFLLHYCALLFLVGQPMQ